MASVVRNCLGIDIGTQFVRLVHMEMGKAGPRVLALIEEPIKVEPSMTEAQRSAAVARQLQEILKRERIRTRNAVFCVPGLSVFTRKFPLPKASPEQLNRMIRFEARQQIPFPLDKTIMEYQIFEEGDANEVQVLLVAIKREFIMNFMRLVRRAGLRPLAISTSTLALYNFHELNNSTRDLSLGAQAAARKKAKPAQKKSAFSFSLKRKKKPAAGASAEAESAPDAQTAEDEEPLEAMGFEEIQAYVNLGASLIDIAIPKPGPSRMVGFPRSVPLAGNAMDQAIRERLGEEDLQKVRQIKEKQTAVLSTEFEVSGDSAGFNMEASEAATRCADRIVAELRRTLDYYISQPDGVAVDSLVLSGGLAQMPFLASYIEEKMGLPVALAQPKNDQLRMPDSVPDSFCPFVIAVGLALQGLRLAQNQIDFLPEEVKNIRSFQERRLEAAAMVAMLAVMIALSWNIGQGQRAYYQQQIEQYQAKKSGLSAMNKRIDEALDRRKKVATAYEQLAKAGGNLRRDYWFLILTKILEKKPPQLLVDQLDLRSDGYVILRGCSERPDFVTTFVAGLSGKGDDPVLNLLIPGSRIEQIDATPVMDPRFNTGVHRFVVRLRVMVRAGRYRPIGQPPEPKPEAVATPAPAGNLY